MTPRRLIEPARLAGGPLLRTQTDERLVDLTRAGNDRAFEAIVHRYRRPLLRYCSRLLPPQRAEDAVQQALVSAYGAMCSSEAELKLRPWLYRIAHNASLNLLRQNGWDHDEIDETVRISEDGPDVEAERNERLETVLRAVEELPERQRDAVLLRALEGRSYEEIAVALDVSGGAVRQLLNRARTTLRSAATALTPPELLVRLGGGAVSDGPRVAEVVAGAGGAATLAKIGAAVVVAGAVAGSAAVDGPLPVIEDGGEDRRGAVREARGSEPIPGLARGAANGSGERASRVAGGRSGRRSGGGDAGDVVRDSSGSGGGDSSGSGSDGDSDDGIVIGDNSGPGSDSSGSGSSGSSGGDSSGPGSGGTLDTDGDSSGPGSGALVDRSGPGDGSGSSGSGSSGSSGSGSSGSGSGG